jgi:hypothetical protein
MNWIQGYGQYGTPIRSEQQHGEDDMSEGKQRHGCLLAWLILMIIGNSLVALLYLLAGGLIKQVMPNIPDWSLPVLGLLCIVNVVCAVALLKWKKWGFYGVAGTSAAAFVINLALGQGIIQSLLGLLGIAILYGVLQIGKDNVGWTQLE